MTEIRAAFIPRWRPTRGMTTLGDGFLMRHGFAVLFCGWQADVPAGCLGLQVPEAVAANGERLQGQTYQQFQINRATHEIELSDRGHRPLPAADLNDPTAMLVGRDWVDGPATVIPRSQWEFARWVDGHVVPDPNYACLPAGFQLGKVYDVVYTTVGAPVMDPAGSGCPNSTPDPSAAAPE